MGIVLQNSLKQNSFPVLIFIIASLLVMASFPRFIASVKALYPKAVLAELSAGQELPATTFLQAQHNLSTAIEWVDASYFWRQLSDLQFKYFLLYASDLDNIHNALLETSATTDLALSLMPVAPYTWYDRAVIDSMDEQGMNRALESLAMSIYVDRINKNLLQARVMFLWENLANCNEELRSLFKSQLLLFWELRHRQLIKVLKANPEMQPWLVEGLSTSPDELIRLNRLLRK